SGSINKQIFPLIVEPLKAELTLSDAQIGILTGLAPGLFAGVATLGLGWLADRMARQWLLAICVLVWSAATLVMGLATTFAGLVVGAFVLSMGEMALLPVFNSVVPDLFGQSLRRRINLAYGAVIVASAGAMLALAGAGLTFLAEHRDALPEVLRNLSTWRVAFVLTAALGLPLALGILWAGPVPRTGSAIAKEPAASFFQRHLRATLGLYAAVCLFGIGSSAVLSWTTIYMMRRFTLGPAELGAGVGGVLLASAILGILVSGIALKRLERSDPHTAPLKLYIAAFLLSIVPGALLLVVDNLTLAYVLMAAQFTLIFAAMAHNFSLVQELSPANARGQASGLFALSAGVVPAFAPLLVGLISDRLGTGAEGLMLAIMGVSIPAYLLGALVLRSRSLGYADVIRDANEPATPV
ncbi:MAG: hypothetical protein RIQ46_1878, partial [Pseudomonadota bacterium]